MALPASITIGSRRSQLAMAQSQLVADALLAAWDGLAVEIVGMDTLGDRTAGPLTAIGGKGLFTTELEAALRDGRVDLAIHSAKDLPVDLPADMAIAAVPPREDARDCLVCGKVAGEAGAAGALASLPKGAVVGTSSLRRRAQVLAMRGDLSVVPLRGNVETRVGRALSGEMDAVVLAMAGLRRCGLAARHAEHIIPLELDVFVPAAAQGALAVQCAAARGDVRQLLAAIDHAPSHAALDAERSVLAAMGADCGSCVAVHVAPAAAGWAGWAGWAMIADVDGTNLRRFTARGDTAAKAATALLECLR
jgi:hydroxymethylbilane synthase